MELTHVHLLLDRIREDQHHHGAMLQDIADRQEEGLKLLKGIFKLARDRPSAKPSKIAALLPQLATSTFAQCAASLLLLIYILKGGDIPTAVATLGKLFGLP